MTCPYALCAEINGSCPCARRKQRPCEATEWMAKAGVTAEMELARIARQTASGPATKDHKWGRPST